MCTEKSRIGLYKGTDAQIGQGQRAYVAEARALVPAQYPAKRVYY